MTPNRPGRKLPMPVRLSRWPRALAQPRDTRPPAAPLISLAMFFVLMGGLFVAANGGWW